MFERAALLSWVRTRRLPPVRALVVGGLVVVFALLLAVRILGPAGDTAGLEADADAGAAGDRAGEGADPVTDSGPLMDAQGPGAGLLALTTAREHALEAGDVHALEALTVPGSPAAVAEDSGAAADFAGTDVTLSLVVLDERTDDRGTGQVLATLATTVSTGSEETVDHGTRTLLVDLHPAPEAPGGWQVHTVSEVDPETTELAPIGVPAD
ncbi:hypothetical protein [Brevibacterium litoralis]|uniref:hypothetical protein n=1 Tax=Brevibacterium litoralis TaxID=3138935 RepID=UPI0032EFAE8A